MLNHEELEMQKQFDFFNDAPDAVAVIKVVTENNRPIDYKIIYINKAIEEISGYTKPQLLNGEVHENLKKCNAEIAEMCYNAAYNGQKKELIEYDKHSGKQIKLSCWQIKKGYAGFIVNDITDTFLLESTSDKQYKKIEVLLRNSIDFIFDLDLDTKIMCSDGYSQKRNKLIEKEYKIPEEWLEQELITQKSAIRINYIIEEIKAGNSEASTKIELRKHKDEPFEWYKLVLYTYYDPINDKDIIIGYAKNDHHETMLLSKLHEQASKDLMTGVYNATAAKKRIKKVLDTNAYNAFFIIDIDDFKQVNDAYGHPCGDKAIKLVAEVINDSFRHSDIVYRLGGDEFGGLAIGMSNQEHIKVMCDDIHRNLANTKIIDCAITVSIGVALNVIAEATYEEYYDAADKALYKAKMQGKNGYYIECF